jgi:hypothetical protein
MGESQESRDDRVRRVALDAARTATGNSKLTIVDVVNSGTAMAIGSALAEEFKVEILGDSSQEMGGSRIEDWVEYMNTLLDG